MPTDRYLQGVTRLGRPSVGHASSAGKVMLAFGDVPLPRGRLASFTPRTITEPAALVREIEQVRARGYAEAIEEREAGLSAIAAPVWGAGGDLAAIVALQGPTSRFDGEATTAAVPLLVACARAHLGRARLATGQAHVPRRHGAGHMEDLTPFSSLWRQLRPTMDDSGLTPTPLHA